MKSQVALTRLRNAIPDHIADKLSRANRSDMPVSVGETLNSLSYEMRRLGVVRRGYWAMMAEKSSLIPCAVQACDDEEFVAQVLSEPNKTGSFVEIVLRPGHELYSFVREKVGMLNMAGEEHFIEDLGENFGKQHYNIYITPEQHAIICNNSPTTNPADSKE